jgi:VanZ family protein
MRWIERVSLPARRRLLICYWIGIFGMTHWPDVDRLGPDPFPEFDKLVHASFYAGWGVLWFWLVRAARGHVSRAAAVWLLVAGAAYGAFDELSQAIVGRQPDILDWSCDMVGLAVALAVLRLLQTRLGGTRTSGLNTQAA